MKRRSVLLGLSALTLSAIAPAATMAQQAPLNPPVSLTVGYQKVGHLAPIILIADDLKKQGVDIKLVEFARYADARTALEDIDAALETVSGARADFGAAGNRLQSVVNTIQTASENLSAANSRIRDVNVAEETAKMARANVLMQAGVSVLAQANQAPQMALKLLG